MPSGPKNVAYWLSTRSRRWAADRRLCARASSPPMNPKMHPGVPSTAESSNVAFTGPIIDTAVPFSPASRQNALS